MSVWLRVLACAEYRREQGRMNLLHPPARFLPPFNALFLGVRCELGWAVEMNATGGGSGCSRVRIDCKRVSSRPPWS